MQTLQQTVRVNFHYSVRFTRRVFDPSNQTLRNVIAGAGRAPAKTLFVVDELVCASYPGLLDRIAEYCRVHSAVIQNVTSPVVVPGGETVKNTTQCVDLIQNLINDYGVCRHSFVVVVGGGAVLDMAGYASATAHRGIRLIRLPTTVLSQNDSGVGVKTSINRYAKKNFLGTFTPPYAVINDFEFLDSLSDRDWRSGMAEAVKVSLIKDAAFFEYIEASAGALSERDRPAMERLVFRCAQLHLQHIAGSDPFEAGSSRPLDFGHWSAHKLEQLTSHRLRHGEAVAIGIALDTTYSHLAGMLSHGSWTRVIEILLALGFTLYVPELENGHAPCSALLDGLAEFREHLGGELTIMLLEEIGRGVETHEIDTALVIRSVQTLRQFAAKAQPGAAFLTSLGAEDFPEDLWIDKAPARLQ
jgi:3-dehydroquinate synthase